MIPIPQKKIEQFCNKHHIAKLALFGSILTPHFSNKSDIDFLVEFEQGYIPTLFGIVDMEAELSSITGRPVDLRTAQDLSPFFRQEVLNQAKTIYVR